MAVHAVISCLTHRRITPFVSTLHVRAGCRSNVEKLILSTIQKSGLYARTYILFLSKICVCPFHYDNMDKRNLVYKVWEAFCKILFCSGGWHIGCHATLDHQECWTFVLFRSEYMTLQVDGHCRFLQMTCPYSSNMKVSYGFLTF